MKHDIKNHTFSIKNVPARKAQKYIYIMQECEKDGEVDLMQALLSPAFCDTMDTLLDYVFFTTGGISIPCNDKNIDDAELTVADIIELKSKVIEQLLIPLKNAVAPSIKS